MAQGNLTSETRDLVSKASSLIGEVGSHFYFNEATLAAGREHGLDGFRFYFLGRGGVLGDVEASVVASAFGYFHPGLVEKMWTSAQAATELTPRQAGRRYLECCADFGRRHLSDVPGLAEFCAAAEAVNRAADPAGLALYAGIAAEPLPDDPPGRAMQLCAVLREFRGSTHLVAVLATPGLDPRLAHGIRRPEMWAMFGYDEADLPAATDEARTALAAADDLTDRLLAPAYEVLDSAAGADLIAGLEAIRKVLPDRSRPTGG